MPFGNSSPMPPSAPPAPREPSERARKLVFRLNAGQWIVLLVGLFFFGLGALFTVIFAWSLPKDIAIDLGARRAQGEVLSAKLNRNVKINGVHPTTIRFRYSVDGKRYESRTDALEPQLPAEPTGAPIDVEYSSMNPGWGRTAGGEGYGQLFVLLFPLIGGGMVFFTLRSHRRDTNAFVNGLPVLATVVFTGPDTSVTVNGRHPFKVKWSFSVEGREYTGSISSMNANDLADFAQQTELTVLYLPDSPKANILYVA